MFFCYENGVVNVVLELIFTFFVIKSWNENLFFVIISACSKSSRSNDVITQHKINNAKYSALMGRRRSMLLVVGWFLYKFWLFGYWF